MEKLYKIFIGLSLLALIITGCNEDPVLSKLKKVSFTAPISASVNKVTLNEGIASDNVITFSWPSVDYFIEAPVTYSIQVTTKDDLAEWANAAEIEVGNDLLTVNISGEQLNTIATELGLEPGVEQDLVFRVKSFVDRAAYSENVTVAVTAYEVITSSYLWVPGAYEGWNPAAAPTIVSLTSNGVYEGYLYLPAGEIKLTAQPDWTPMAYGDGGNGVLIEANYAGGNFNVATEGYYLIATDLNNMKYLLIKTTWGIIGGATPGGWSSDTPMTYNSNTKIWSVTCNMLAAGSFKFRANGAWQLDFGHDNDGNIVYCNHPWLAYIDQPQFTVPSDGNYTINLDLSVPGHYQYNIVKN